MSGTKSTPEGTRRYAGRLSADVPAEHFRQFDGMAISSIGIGTYLGEPDDRTDKSYEEAIRSAIECGCNLIDSAINYRFQRSERNIGAVLSDLFQNGTLSRDEIIVCTKGGFLSFDGGYPTNPRRYFEEEFVAKGICVPDDLVAGCHCMTPAYLEDQIDRSLKNLKLSCIDIYYLHNPEIQLAEISRQDFLKRTLAAFKLLEKKVAEGKIYIYGAATWNGFRESPDSPGYLSLEELIGLAREAGGDGHHFRAVQLPYNLAMPEAFLSKNQKLGSKSVSLIESASGQNMAVFCSAAILQGQLSRNLPDMLQRVFGMRTDSQRAIQFTRSTPGVTAALVGMSREPHVNENMEVAKFPPAPWTEMRQIFQ
jgi:aryl-alcohol dehydrogenase-like predicted oxidoreductase